MGFLIMHLCIENILFLYESVHWNRFISLLLPLVVTEEAWGQGVTWLYRDYYLFFIWVVWISKRIIVFAKEEIRKGFQVLGDRPVLFQHYGYFSFLRVNILANRSELKITCLLLITQLLDSVHRCMLLPFQLLFRNKAQLSHQPVNNLYPFKSISFTPLFLLHLRQLLP